MNVKIDGKCFDINSKLKTLRINLRKYGNIISEDVFYRYHPVSSGIKGEICVFCNNDINITREHVVPRWVFEKDVKSTFVSKVNMQTQTYNKAVIPTCAECNNSILGEIEIQMLKVINRLETSKYHTNDDLIYCVRWMEILDYKSQVFDCRRKFIKHGNSSYDQIWGTLPLAIMRHFFDMNPFKVLSYLRNAQRRIIVKSKNKRINSLVVFETKYPHFNFFTQPNEYIFVSFPMSKIAIFYFLRNEYDDNDIATEEALYYMQKVFET